MKVGILGTGKIVQEFLPWLVEHAPFTVQALCSTPRSAEKAQELCRQYGVPQHTTNYLEIPSFPSVYNTNNGKIRLGECMLWVIESIRQGTAPSLGCRMVLANADNYEAIFFLTDDEVLDAAACYRRWWEGRKYPKTSWTIDPCYDEPLCGTGYRWW